MLWICVNENFGSCGQGIVRVSYNLAKNILLLEPNSKLCSFDLQQKILVTNHRAEELIKNLQSGSLSENFECNFKLGDTLFFLDPTWAFQAYCCDYIYCVKYKGVRIVQIMHDFMPLTHPETVELKINRIFRAWFSIITLITDKIVCVSKATQDLCNYYLPDIPSSYFHLGNSFFDIPKQEIKLPLDLVNNKTILMVSTIEPRKKYFSTMLAMERVWETNPNVNLIIVGSVGWYSDHTVEYIVKHPQYGKKVIIVNNPPDEILAYLYSISNLFLFSSDSEGFGLPVIEAASFGVPLLLRDIPPFREIAGDYASYFSNFLELPKKITFCLENEGAMSALSKKIKIKNWKETTRDATLELKSF